MASFSQSKYTPMTLVFGTVEVYDFEFLVLLRYPKYMFVHAVSYVTGNAVELALRLPYEGFVSLEAGRLVPNIQLATESKVQVLSV